jgi:hypothetical protein
VPWQWLDSFLLVARIMPDVSFVVEDYVTGNQEMTLGYNTPDGFHNVRL